MRIIRFDKIDMGDYDIDSSCDVYIVHVQISNVNEQAEEMIHAIASRSWITKLSAVDKASFTARAKRTIEELVNGIFSKVTSPISENFGQYMVSLSAQDVLCTRLKHKKVPLSEIFKERVTGNSGFDFHTESHSSLIAFGEAKYSGSINPYPDALVQIVDFITAEKDIMELTDLSRFICKRAIDNALSGKKAYIAAFSINAIRPNRIFTNILTSNYIDTLLSYPELYLIGVEVDDQRDN